MLERTLNLGILAHVDAGKTTLTERLLYAAGVIDELGRVDDGTTQTDTLPLEQRRGITIKAAVVSFAIEDVRVNLIDTPGHPDFIAEVERVLSVLDGAVLVISAVEGVQSQTPLLMRALQRLFVPTLIFVNKLDRVGADPERVLQEISARLTPAVVAVEADAARLVEVLAERDDSLLTAYVEGDGIPARRLREELVAQTGQALVHPVFFGSAKTGAGVEELMAGIAELLPAAAGDADGPASGSVFKIERGPAGEKVAYVRMFSGTVHARERLNDEKVTAVSVFEAGDAERRASVSAGEIAKLWGLGSIQIGDRIGDAPEPRREFPPPTLESVVFPTDPDDGAALRVALGQLAEQDPLIDVRQDGKRGEISVSLYGEVQKEVIQATLAEDYGIDVEFRETTTICIERPLRTGRAVEILQAVTHPFSATVGLRVDPAPIGSGVQFRLDIDSRLVPLYIYKTAERFTEAMTLYVDRTLREGLFGWQVTDCAVTMIDCNYYIGDGPAKPSGSTPRTTAADFRKLTPPVLMQALERAGTVVCEPTVRVGLEIPAEAIGAVMAALSRLDASLETPSPEAEVSTITAVLPAARADDLQRQLPGLTGGEGVLESSFAGYRPVSGDPPTRTRTMPNPLDLRVYLMALTRPT